MTVEAPTTPMVVPVPTIKNSRRITCRHFYCYTRSNKLKKENKIHDNLASRKKSTLGKSYRTTTGKATVVSGERCGSFFIIKVDCKSYHMTIGTGNGKHGFHAPHNLASVATPKQIKEYPVVSDMQRKSQLNIESLDDIGADTDTGNYFDNNVGSNINEQVEAEQNTRRTNRRIDAHELLGPKTKEILSMAEGISEECLQEIESRFSSILSYIKEKQVTTNVNKDQKGRL